MDIIRGGTTDYPEFTISLSPTVCQSLEASASGLMSSTLLGDSTISHISISCPAGHECMTPPELIGKLTVQHDCAICSVLDVVHATDPGIVCLQDSYEYGQEEFEMICSQKHHFVVSGGPIPRVYNASPSVYNASPSVYDASPSVYNASPRTIVIEPHCGVCRTAKLMRKNHNYTHNTLRADTHCVHVHIHSLLRMRCNRLRHNPDCNNAHCIALATGPRGGKGFGGAPGCYDYVRCGRDFYTTEYLARKNRTIAFACKDDHFWGTRELWGVHCTKRLYETLFDCRFDDQLLGADLTGYNANLGIAFTHMIDPYASKHAATAQQICTDAGIHFCVIPAKARKPAAITAFVVRTMTDVFDWDKTIVRDLQPTPGKFIGTARIREIRRRVKSKSADHLIYESRCEF